MRQIIVGVVVLLVSLMAMNGASAQTRALEVREWGVVVSVAWEDRSVLVTHGDGYLLLSVEDSADIREVGGAALALSDIRVGQRIEFQAEEWKGMWFARSLAVARNVSAGSLKTK
jgi:hypothetical protein